ncbi:MAG: hypothetical protein FWG90_06060 [Oscillospiraceae bacterium]|nr:hypothetical protein [Oscillospiraceae bacterium]
MISSLEHMKNIDVRTVNPDELVDIKSVTINTTLPQNERLLDYLGQIKNPYCFKHGKTVIKIAFADTEATLEDRLEKYLLSI